MKRYRRPPAMVALASFVLATGLASCQSYVFEPVVPALISVNNKTYELPDLAAADILFVIDDSGSMAGEQSNLANNFDVFINALEQESADRVAEGKTELAYRLAVASTSIGLRYEDATGSLVDLTTYTTETNCQTSYPIAAGSPFPTGTLMAAPGNAAVLDSTTLDSASIITQFKQNAQLGVCGSGQEQGLLAMRRALEQNPTFAREKSRLVVVFLSDEEDCSDPDRDLTLQIGADLCVAEAGKPDGGKLGPVADYATFLNSLSKNVVVGSIVSANGTAPDVTAGTCRDANCEANCGSGGDPRGSPCYCGGQAPGGRYLRFADLVGNGSLKDSICQTSFSDTLRRLAEVIIEVKVIYLASRPFDDDPSLVLLKIIRDGNDILCNSPSASIQADASQSCVSDPNLDWEYDADELSIRLCDRPSSTCKIQQGDSYKVSYVERACSTANPC